MRLVIIGGGNMGGAILLALVKAKVFSPNNILLIEPDEQKRFVVGNIFVLQRERERDCRIQSFRVLLKP